MNKKCSGCKKETMERLNKLDYSKCSSCGLIRHDKDGHTFRKVDEATSSAKTSLFYKVVVATLLIINAVIISIIIYNFRR